RDPDRRHTSGEGELQGPRHPYAASERRNPRYKAMLTPLSREIFFIRPLATRWAWEMGLGECNRDNSRRASRFVRQAEIATSVLLGISARRRRAPDGLAEMSPGGDRKDHDGADGERQTRRRIGVLMTDCQRAEDHRGSPISDRIAGRL